MKKFIAIFRDCSCDEEDKTYTFKKYFEAQSIDDVERYVKNNIKLNDFCWLNKIEETTEFNLNPGCNVIRIGVNTGE